MYLRRFFFFSFISFVVLFLSGCKDNKGKGFFSFGDDNAAAAVQDTAIYGQLGEHTTKEKFELVDEKGISHLYDINKENGATKIIGVISPTGRYVVVTAKDKKGHEYAQKIICIDGLYGKWYDLMNNEITFEKDGSINSDVIPNSDDPYSEWSICNGNLILDKDTFEIQILSRDLLCLGKRDSTVFFNRYQNPNPPKK